MQRQRNASDVAIELRRQFGLPKDAPIVARLATLAALTPVFLLRHSVGVRLVGMPRLVILLLSMLVFGLVPSLVLAQTTAMTDELWRPMLMLTAATIGAGAMHRLRRWSMRLRGEKLHSLSLGTSWLSFVIPKGNAERYADPAITIGIGAALVALEAPPALLIVAAWLILSGVNLYAIEKYVHELQLDQYDALLNAEAHEQVTALYLKGMSEHLQQVKPSAPLSTGIDSELASAIASRPRAVAIEQTEGRELPAATQTPDSPEQVEAPPETQASRTPLPAARDEAKPAPGKTPEELARTPRNSGSEPLTIIVLAALFLLLLIFGRTVDRWLNIEPISGPDQIETVVIPSEPARSTAPAPASTSALHYAEALRARAKSDPAGVSKEVTQLLKGAENGYPSVQSIVGHLYLQGTAGLPKRIDQAMHWLDRAAEKGDADAMYTLATILEDGLEGAPKNEFRATLLYASAAEQNQRDAQFKLGTLLIQGLYGLKVAPAEGVQWIARASANGHPQAALQIKRFVQSAREGSAALAALLRAAGIDVNDPRWDAVPAITGTRNP